MARVKYFAEEAERDGPHARGVAVYEGGSFRQELSGAMRSAWASPSGRALADALARAVPRQQMHAAMAPLALDIHRRLASVGPQLSRSFREIWGSSY